MIMTQQIEGIYDTYYDDPRVISMSAASESSVDLDGAQRIVKAAYHGQRKARKLEDLGADSKSCPQYLITLDDKSQLLLRLAPPSDMRVLQHERDALSGDMEVLELVRENAPSVPIPQIILDSRSTAASRDDANSTLPDNTPFVLTTHVPGMPLDAVKQDLPDEVLAVLDYQLGQHARQISRIHHSHFGFASGGRNGAAPAKAYTTWRAAFLSMFEAVMRDAEDLFVSVPYEVLRWQVGRLAHTLDEVKVPQLVCCGLGDARRGVMVDPATGRLTGLVDFERAVWGDPLMMASFREPTLEFLNGYGGNPLGPSGASARVLLYTLYYYLGAVVEVYYHSLNHELERTARKGLVRCLKSISEYKS
ncbi:hypothetical protein DRE_05956 [Drechslerella stenobrocha 248]|uniref:Aminoglycoside phosphotransferase domain-containing protein n=1 Tax=Drechslerella stenobrocha 248 TaxID=1043628 RepID=W7HQ09_9PEZI|nr:hypothetical protein DRE_05956 [Drechslerella stenobrocha 248]